MQRMNSLPQTEMRLNMTWQERLSRLMHRPERKPRVEAETPTVEAMSDHVQTLMMSDLFWHK